MTLTNKPRTTASPTQNGCCLCRACGEVFAGISLFDKHRKGDHAVERYCVDPETVGLVIGTTSSGTVWRSAV